VRSSIVAKQRNMLAVSPEPRFATRACIAKDVLRRSSHLNATTFAAFAPHAPLWSPPGETRLSRESLARVTLATGRGLMKYFEHHGFEARWTRRLLSIWDTADEMK